MAKRPVLTGQNGHLETENANDISVFFEFKIKHLISKTIVHSDDNFMV